MKKILRHCWFYLIWLIPVLVGAQMNQGVLISKNQYFEVPWEGFRKSVKVPVKLGETKIDFMVDSGAPCFISLALQKKKQYKTLMVAISEDSGGNKDSVVIVLIDDIQLGNLAFSGIPALVFDFEKMPFRCDCVEGNFGSNLMRFLVVQYDLKQKKVSFSDNAAMIPAYFDTFYPLTLNDQSDAYFMLDLPHGLVDTVHFDSGSSSFYEMSFSMAERFRKASPNSVIAEGFGSSSQGVNGKSKDMLIYQIKAKTLEIGGQKLKNQQVDIAVNNKSRMGRNLLNHGVLRLDYVHKRYTFSKYAQALEAPRSDFGFAFQSFQQKLQIGVVWQNTEAARKGMHTGDEVISLNGKNLDGLDDCVLDSLVLQSFSRGRIAMTLRSNNGLIHTIDLKKQHRRMR